MKNRTKANRFFAALIAAGAATPLAQAAPLAPSAFAYDRAAPLNVRVNHRAVANGIARLDVTFAGSRGPIHGEIVAPLRASRHPGVLFVHWLGDDAATTNLTEFEPDAIALARRHVASVLIDAMWARPKWFSQGRSPATDYRDSIAQVVDLRRALDLLLAQAGVDPHRIAYVGHDFGAMYGALLSGIDPRAQWYVLMAGTTSFSDWYLLGKKPVDVAAYRAQMAPLDPGQYLSESNARGFMFQYAAKDEYITPANELGLFDAAPLPRALFVYASDHSLRTPQAFHDRVDWLTTRLGQ